jgi:hypothetical protein
MFGSLAPQWPSGPPHHCQPARDAVTNYGSLFLPMSTYLKS